MAAWSKLKNMYLETSNSLNKISVKSYDKTSFFLFPGADVHKCISKLLPRTRIETDDELQIRLIDNRNF